MRKIVISCVAIIITIAAMRITDLILVPTFSMEVGVRQTEDSMYAFHEIQTLEYLKSITSWAIYGLLVLFLFFIWKKQIMKGYNNAKKIIGS